MSSRSEALYNIGGRNYTTNVAFLDRLRAEVADRGAVIARLQPTWETP